MVHFLKTKRRSKSGGHRIHRQKLRQQTREKNLTPCCPPPLALATDSDSDDEDAMNSLLIGDDRWGATDAHQDGAADHVSDNDQGSWMQNDDDNSQDRAADYVSDNDQEGSWMQNDDHDNSSDDDDHDKDESDDFGSDDNEGGSIDDDADDPIYMPSIPVALNKRNIKPKVEVIKHAFQDWWLSDAGGKKEPKIIAQLATNVVKFLHAVHNEALICNISLPPSIGIIEFFVQLIVRSPLLACMNRYLMKYPYRPSSLASHLLDVMEASRRLAMHPDAISTKGFNGGLTRFQTSATQAIRGAKRTVRREQKRKDKSIESAVANKQYPARGMPELQEMVDADVAAMKLIMNGDPVLTKVLYSTFLGLLFVLFYIHAPQGRIGGIENLEMKHVAEFNSRGYCLNKAFKTTQKFLYQPVVLNPVIFSMLNIFLSKLRPAIIPQGTDVLRTDPLFVSFDGKQVTNAGRLITAYFREKNFDINSTRLRAIVETEASERLKRGEITGAQRAAISIVSGHSGGTARDYYVRENFDADVQRARAAFGLPAQFASPEALPVVYAAEVWGTQHPSHATAKRAKWSDEEIAYLSNLVDTIKAEARGIYSGCLMSECLRRIRADRTTRAIFHQRHVFNTDRLRTGYRFNGGASEENF